MQYRIIEPRLIDPLMAEVQYHEFSVAIFHWLVHQLNIDLKDELGDFIIDVIRVEYLGAYPALGIRYPPKDVELDKLIEETCDRLLRERPISELMEFIASSGVDWKEVTTKLMAKERKE